MLGNDRLSCCWCLPQISTASCNCKLSPLKSVMSPFCLSRFSYLVASMGLQMLWSFGLACLDAYAIKAKKDLTSPLLLSLFVVGDWVLTKLILKLMSSILLSWLLRKGFLCLLNCLDKHLKSCVLLHCFIQALKLSIWKNQTD